MKVLANFEGFHYIESNSKIVTSLYDRNQLLHQGYEDIRKTKNGNFMLAKPATVEVQLSFVNSQGIADRCFVNLRNYVVDFYNRKKVSYRLAEAFQNDCRCNRFNFFIDDVAKKVDVTHNW